MYSIGEGEKFKLTSNQVQGQKPEKRGRNKNNLQLADIRRNTMLQAQERGGGTNIKVCQHLSAKTN